MRSFFCLLALPVLLFAEPPKRGDSDFDPFADYNHVSRKVEPPPAPKGREPETAKLIRFDVKLEPATVKRGEVVKLTINGKPIKDHWTYPLTVRSPAQLEGQLGKIAFKSDKFKLLGQPLETDAEFAAVGDDILLKHLEPFTWTLNLLVDPKAKPGSTELDFAIELQVCDDHRCTPGTHEFHIPVTIGDADPVAAPDPTKTEVGQPIKITVKEPPAGFASSAKKGDDGLFAFILQGIFWGAVSLLTPCVFPMIPITVSYFLKQSEKEGHKPLLTAGVYCATIVIVLTIAAVALLSFFRAVSTHWAMNFGLGALFVFFALSLFGMYEIELPSGLARFTSSHEGNSYVGTMFMALTFTIISFACVAPFLGGFGGTAASNNLGFGKIFLGGLAFSITFASPFLVLALFPALLKKMPKSGTWLNSVKVVMGFLELAAGLKFFRQGELLITNETSIFTYDFVMALYIAICLLCGLYLLCVYRLPHDTPIENLGVSRMLIALLFLGLGFYLVPAAFAVNAEGKRQRPRGAIFSWLDSFLLTEDKLNFMGDLDEALALAEMTPGKRIFLDFTGKTCTNCKLNEKNVFPLQQIKELMDQYILVAQYTDVVPDYLYPPKERSKLTNSRQKADARKNLEFQREKFGTEQLPLYAVVEPDGNGGWRKVAVYDEGKINDVPAFEAFLRDSLRAMAK